MAVSGNSIIMLDSAANLLDKENLSIDKKPTRLKGKID